MFIEFSTVHSSDNPLISNLRTEYIYPQYHVVFDDTLSTIPSIVSDEDPPIFWNTVDLDENTIQILLDERTSV